MCAQPGDWLVVKSGRAEAPDRYGRIVAVGTPDGGPPFTVRWFLGGYVSTIFPGPDALVLTEAQRKAPAPNGRARRRGNRSRRGTEDVGPSRR
ncbi:MULTISPECIES: DUF1918 domain-containing protein [Amycolatopsis]|uniref:DUF1918 domain-containing protein n=1 Tax=Amycolatopsis dendrobii TaxID=2760662 RepID=A0A7W3VWH3_9PSEU|nr:MULTISPECIES: DUF1918 domain-containing protein [Amycolatopsis]MBB1154491.1 DUF1918 domain-containing protein [Amycolatopsis dendrobii]UKD56694.1 DUF1918 domain-containing protein [Amycolatopsis sp. FU40]